MKKHTLLLIIILTSLGACTLDEIQDMTTSTLPIANFEIGSQSNNSNPPSTVVFQNTSTNSDSYIWNFGDLLSGNNNTSTETNPTHTFENTGVYTVTLTARNDTSGEEDIFNLSVTVGEVTTFSKVFSSLGSARDIIQTTDGGYAVVGTNNNRALLTRLDYEGNTLPNMPKFYDSHDSDYGEAIVQTSDGGFAIAGAKSTTGNGLDFQLILTDSEGNELVGSPKIYSAGLSGSDYAKDIIQTNNGGFAIIGKSYNGSDEDVWLVLTDSNGNELPNSPKRFHGNFHDDVGNALIQMDNGNIAIVGSTFNGTTDHDVWLIITDSEGNEIIGSPKSFHGGYEKDKGYDIIQTENGGLAICGTTRTSVSSLNDVWLILTDANGNELANSPKTFNGVTQGEDFGYSITTTSTGGFAIAGYVTNPDDGNDVWLILTDENGNELQNSPISFDHLSGTDKAYSIISTNDGGFAIAATHQNMTNSSVWIIKTDAEGIVD